MVVEENRESVQKLILGQISLQKPEGNYWIILGCLIIVNHALIVKHMSDSTILLRKSRLDKIKTFQSIESNVSFCVPVRVQE